MKNFNAMILAVAIASLSGEQAQAGFLSNLRDRVTGGGQQEQQVYYPQQQQDQQQQQQQQAPPPAEQANRKSSSGQKSSGQSQQRPQSAQAGAPQGQQPQQPQATPDPQKVKEGARKLAKQLNWEKVPNNLFSKYAGSWTGHFWVYSPLGQKEQVSQVQIDFTPQGDGSMLMQTLSYDMISKMWVTQENSTYRINGDAIEVDIQRPTGDRARQTGHYSDGQIFFKADISDGVEHYRERVDGNRLLVDGFGVYGGIKGSDHHVFIGRLTRK